MKEVDFIKIFNQEHKISYDRFCELVSQTGYINMPLNQEELDNCLSAIEVEVRSDIDIYGELLEVLDK